MTPRRRLARRAGLAALATLWFALWFFAVFPLGIQLLAGGALALDRGVVGALGLALVAGSNALIVVWVGRFVREGGGTHAPFRPPERMLVSGAFGRVRNPMYVAYLAVIAGEALALRSGWIALYALGFAGLAHAYVVRVEEPALRRRFGAAYDAYCERVPRWLPRL